MKGRTTVAALSLLLVLAASCDRASDAALASPSDATPQPLPEGRTLESGTYAIELDGHQIAFDLPSGWEGFGYGVFPSREGAGPPTGRGVSFWLVDNIYANPCRWDEGLLDPPPKPSADALADALKTQWGRDATQPTTGSLNGNTAIEMDLTVPADLDLGTCARNQGEHYFLYWPQRVGGGRYTQGPGQREHLWILDLDGARLVVDASSFPKTSPEARTELWDIATSVRVT